MKQTSIKRILSFVLVFCLLASMFPSMGLMGLASAAEPDDPPGQPVPYATLVTTEEELRTAIQGQTEIQLGQGELRLSEPVVFPEGRTITIYGAADGSSTIQTTKGSTWPAGSSSLFVLSKGTNLTLRNLTLNGESKTRGIIANEDGAEIYLWNVNVTNGFSDTQSGAGIHLHGDVKLVIRDNCTFKYNKANTVAPTAGGAIYAGPGSEVVLWGTKPNSIKFYGNTAHSGACIYAYKSYVMGRYCEFGVPNQEANTASQRGGAIHCHGTMVLRDSIVQGNSSGQYGGGIYISASEKDINGMAMLENTAVISNSATNSGGGVFVASNSSLFLKGTSTVTGNSLKTIEGEWKSNIHYTNESGKVIICDDEVGKVGISTVSPTFRKLAVYSLGTAPEAATEFSDRLAVLDEQFQYKLDTSFLLTLSDKFTYDGDAWALMDKKTDKETGYQSLDPAIYREGNLWLHLDPEYIHIHTGGGSTTITKDMPRVVFDYNLPGMTAIIATHPKGTQLKRADGTWPQDPGPTIYMDGVSFTFKGWYTDPRAGSKVDPDTQTITVNSDVVYYAHWDIKPDNPTGGTPAAGKMYLVYFDQNYPGGGFTSAYKVAGSFSFDVEYTFTNPETGDEESGTETITVNIPWGWPGNPYRTGYSFNGWYTSPIGGTAVNKGSWSPSQPTTTLYAQWTANTYPLTWDANGGTGGGNTTQAHDETVKAPTTIPTKTGYEFTGWYLDRSCTIPLTSGTLVTGAATFYAGWTPKEYTITWDAGYTGGAITTVKQYHDEKLNILPAPTREGYKFGGWYKGSTRAESYGKVREDATFTARWTNESQDYTVTVEWDDHSDNDLVRPESITVSLMANGIPTGLSYTLDASDADRSGNQWSYTFSGLDVTDAVSNPITYSVAISSTVSDQYSYGIENKSAELGYILMTHSLITRDVNAYVVWDDDNNQDGLRPSTVTLRLYANGEPVDDGETKVALSGSGNILIDNSVVEALSYHGAGIGSGHAMGSHHSSSVNNWDNFISADGAVLHGDFPEGIPVAVNLEIRNGSSISARSYSGAAIGSGSRNFGVGTYMDVTQRYAVDIYIHDSTIVDTGTDGSGAGIGTGGEAKYCLASVSVDNCDSISVEATSTWMTGASIGSGGNNYWSDMELAVTNCGTLSLGGEYMSGGAGIGTGSSNYGGTANVIVTNCQTIQGCFHHGTLLGTGSSNGSTNNDGRGDLRNTTFFSMKVTDCETIRFTPDSSYTSSNKTVIGSGPSNYYNQVDIQVSDCGSISIDPYHHQMVGIGCMKEASNSWSKLCV